MDINMIGRDSNNNNNNDSNEEEHGSSDRDNSNNYRTLSNSAQRALCIIYKKRE